MTAGRHQVLRVLGAASFALAALLTVGPTAGGAEPVVQTGWWYQDVPLTGSAPAQGSVTARAGGSATPAQIAGASSHPGQELPPATLPPPPAPLSTVPPDVTIPDPGGDAPTPSPAPDGGLLVAADPTGIRAMAAIRFGTAADAGGGTLTLTLAPGSTPIVPIQACPALSDWLAGGDQPWSARPAHDCDRFSISGTLSADATTMRWDLPESFRPEGAGVYDVLLLPTVGDGTPFEVAFAAPGADALEVTSTFAPPEEPFLPDFGGELPAPSDLFSADGFTLPPTGSSVGVPTSLEAVSVDTAADDSALRRLQRALENPTTRRLAAAALVAFGAYSTWMSGKTAERRPRLLGALAGGATASIPLEAPPRARGVGRFTRPRYGPAGRL